MSLPVDAVERLVARGMLPPDAVARARGERHTPPAVEPPPPPAPRLWAFVVPGRPVGKARARGYTDEAGDVRARTPDRTRRYERQVGAAARGAGVQLGAGPARLHLRVWTPDGRRFDLDNLLKAIGDALVHAGCLDDDTHQMLPDVRAVWCGVDRDHPRVEVVVELLGDAPSVPVRPAGRRRKP